MSTPCPFLLKFLFWLFSHCLFSVSLSLLFTLSLPSSSLCPCVCVFPIRSPPSFISFSLVSSLFRLITFQSPFLAGFVPSLFSFGMSSVRSRPLGFSPFFSFFFSFLLLLLLLQFSISLRRLSHCFVNMSPSLPPRLALSLSLSVFLSPSLFDH